MTNKIRQQILKVRDDGRTNMLDTNGVMYVANDLQLYELVVYLDDRDNRKEYWNFIMTGEAEITDDDSDEDSAEDGDDDESSPSFHSQQKKEAVTLLSILFKDSPIPDEFDKSGTVYLCDHPSGNPIPIPSEMMDEIRTFEKEHECLVYLVIADSWSYSYLHVSKYKDEWKTDEEDLKEGYPIVYVENLFAPDCSEFGSIFIEPNGSGGYFRVS